MKKIIIVLSLVCVSLFLKVWLDYSKQKDTTLLISTVIAEKRFLKDSFNGLLTINSIDIDSVWLRHGDKIIKFSEVVSFPCLIVYLPSIQEDICNSCIEYALNEVMVNFKEYSRNEHICIISVNSNPEIKERIYKKKCYVVDETLLDVPKANMPYYFVLNKEGHVEFLFAPNFLFKECTTIYWKQLKSNYEVFKANEKLTD